MIVRRIARLFLLLVLFFTPPPNLIARWDSATSATVSWTQSARGCLYRESAIGERVFIGCYERWPATIIVTLGHQGSLSGDLRPMGGDLYVLVSAGQIKSAPLRGRNVYFPVFR
jgi:hypothetical protein